MDQSRFHREADTVFLDRVDAGRRLARRLERFRDSSAVVLGLPRGGVPVAFEVAMALNLPLDVIVVRKLGLPFQPEVAMGAIGEGGARIIDRPLMAYAGVTNAELEPVDQRERAELESRVRRLRHGGERRDLHGRTAIIVDDGVATGATARVACTVARQLGAERVILAIPVAPAEALDEIVEADAVECVSTPPNFFAVGYHYRDFTATTDDEVMVLLDRANSRRPDLALSRVHLPRGMSHAADPQAGLSHAGRTQTEEPALAATEVSRAELAEAEVSIAVPGAIIEGHLRVPENAVGVVVFAHGSENGRYSPRNRFVASVLFHAGLGTLLLDLLTPEEETDRTTLVDMDLHAERLLATMRWLGERSDTAGCRIGLFGASTGAGAALLAAAEAGDRVAAVVSRGGRPDLAGARLREVTAPTLLIVGGADELVLRLNYHARAEMRCTTDLVVVDRAAHLFDEPGALGEVALLARDWFMQYLVQTG